MKKIFTLVCAMYIIILILYTPSVGGDGKNDPTIVIGTSFDEISPSLIKTADGYMIAFSSNINGNWDIFVTTSLDSVNWSEPIAVATDTCNETDPSLIKTANGYMIAFVSDRLTNEEDIEPNDNIFVITSDDGEAWSEPTPVTDVTEFGTLQMHIGPYISLLQTYNGSYMVAYAFGFRSCWNGSGWSNINVVTSEDSVNWSDHTSVANISATEDVSLSLIKSNNNGYMIAYHDNNHIWVTTSINGTNWTESMRVTSPGDWADSYKNPSLIKTDDKYMIAYSRYVGGWIGRWFDIAIITSTNGTVWDDPTTLLNLSDFTEMSLIQTQTDYKLAYCSNASGNWDIYIYSFSVSAAANQRPIVTVTSPKDGETIKWVEEGTRVWINGTAYPTNPDTTILKVEIKIGIRDWVVANGTTNWSYLWDLTQLTDADWATTNYTGNFTILVRAWDGYTYSEYYKLTVHYMTPGQIYSTPLNYIILYGVCLAIVCLVMVAWYVLRFRKKRPV